MQTAAMILGIIVLVGFLVGFIPCLGWFNWLNIPLAFVGLIISIVALSKAQPTENKTGAIVGLVLSAIAILLGIVRLVMGGGVV